MDSVADGRSGYLAAWLGAALGAAAGGVPGATAGALLGDATSTGFDEIGTGLAYATFGVFVGAWIGASIGCAAGLAIRRHPGAGATAVLLALLLGAGAILWAFVLVDANDLLALYVPWTGILTAPLVARSLVVVGLRSA